jgi:hypothetical protein
VQQLLFSLHLTMTVISSSLRKCSIKHLSIKDKSDSYHYLTVILSITVDYFYNQLLFSSVFVSLNL